jgi:hypothetical protein
MQGSEAMGHRWSDDSALVRVFLDVDDRECRHCGGQMHVCDHRRHRIETLEGPRKIVCRLVKCIDRTCPGHHCTVSPEAELALCLPRSIFGWDLFCWIGHRRFSRHWSVPQIRGELQDGYQIRVSDDAIEDVIAKYQVIVAAREQDPERLAEIYRDVDDVVLSIDGLQPEKGHETLYVVRELTKKRVWFGEPLVSSSAPEVRRLIARAREWAERLGKRVRLWISDKQDAFLTGIAAEFPDVPHRFCQNHFLRDVAGPMLEADSHAKVRMRSKVRGLRAIEKDLLATQRAEEVRSETDGIPPEHIASESIASKNIASENIPVATTDNHTPPALSPANAVVLDYCTAVKGILNDDQGGPLHPPGLRMVDALQSVRGSVERCLATKKGALRNRR